MEILYTGELIRLRAYTKEDIPIVLGHINDPDVKGFLTVGIPYPYTLENEEQWYASISATNDCYSFAIERLSDSQYLGGCGVNSVAWKNSVATVGIFLGKEFWGQGYGTDAMRVLVSFIFAELNVNKIKLMVYSFNERAIKSYQKCGFTVEGRLRQEIFRFGRYHDEIIMGILREEYDYKRG